MKTMTIDGVEVEAREHERLVDAIARQGGSVPHVCYHPQLGAIQTCDTCMIEVNGRLRARARRRRPGDDDRDPIGEGEGRADGSVRSHPQQSPPVLHGLRQQQRQLHGPQHHEAAGDPASAAAVQAEALRQSTRRIRSIATTQTSASCAAAASRPVRTSRSTRRCRSTGRRRIRACCGTAARPSGNRAACRAATASRCVPAMR